MKKLTMACLLCILPLFTLTSYGQEYETDFDFEIVYQKTDSTNNGDTIFHRVCNIHLSDTINLSTIYIKVGTTDSTTDVHDFSFYFDDSTSIPTGTSFFREDELIKIKLSDTFFSDTYYYKVYLQNNQGEFSDYKLFN